LAAVQYFRFPYSYTLTPGAAIWHSYGPDPRYDTAAVSVTALAIDGIGGPAHVLTVENINTTQLESGPLPTFGQYLGFSVKNNGGTTIQGYNIHIGMILP
jgi:hypothetical protein